jgi:hypothetical protein
VWYSGAGAKLINGQKQQSWVLCARKYYSKAAMRAAAQDKLFYEPFYSAKISTGQPRIVPFLIVP